MKSALYVKGRLSNPVKKAMVNYQAQEKFLLKQLVRYVRASFKQVRDASNTIFAMEFLIF